MSYDISLNDPLTGETLHTETPHVMVGGKLTVCGDRTVCSARMPGGAFSHCMVCSMGV